RPGYGVQTPTEGADFLIEVASEMGRNSRAEAVEESRDLVPAPADDPRSQCHKRHKSAQGHSGYAELAYVRICANRGRRENVTSHQYGKGTDIEDAFDRPHAYLGRYRHSFFERDQVGANPFAGASQQRQTGATDESSTERAGSFWPGRRL